MPRSQINSTTGQEEWIFYPPSLLPLQNTLRTNPSTGKAYGVDGSATPWIRDGGAKVGVIEPAQGDFIRICTRRYQLSGKNDGLVRAGPVYQVKR